MGIKVKGGDLTGTSKKEKEARAKSFTAKQNATVASRIAQSENGFKGESKNEYGLPNGNQQVQTHVGKEYTGPKDRKQGAPKDVVGADKYADGVKGIKLKPKTSMDSDATRVKSRIGLDTPRESQQKYSNSLSKKSDVGLMEEVIKNTDVNRARLNKKGEEAADSLASRNIKRRGGYKMGTKGIKVKGKSDPSWKKEGDDYRGIKNGKRT